MDQALLEKKRDGFAKVINAAQDVVYIFDLLLPSKIFEDEKVKQAIQNALKRNVVFYVLIGPHHDKSSTFVLTTLKDRITVRNTINIVSFVVADRDSVCYVSRDPDDPRIETASNAPDSARELVSVFMQALCHVPDQEEIILNAITAKLAESRGLIPPDVVKEAMQIFAQYDNPHEAWRRFKEKIESSK